MSLTQKTFKKGTAFQMKEKLSFSLIELLVVIAVISILVSLLLPALNKAREKGRQVRCLSNQKTIGQSCVLYAEDFNQMIWPNYTDETDMQNNLRRTHWKTLALHYQNKYLPTPQYFYCESHKHFSSGKYAEDIKMDWDRNTMNSLKSNIGSSWQLRGTGTSEASSVLLPKMKSSDILCSEYSIHYWYIAPLTPPHLGSFNLLYGDGHAGSVSKAYIQANQNKYNFL